MPDLLKFIVDNTSSFYSNLEEQTSSEIQKEDDSFRRCREAFSDFTTVLDKAGITYKLDNVKGKLIFSTPVFLVKEELSDRNLYLNIQSEYKGDIDEVVFSYFLSVENNLYTNTLVFSIIENLILEFSNEILEKIQVLPFDKFTNNFDVLYKNR